MLSKVVDIRERMRKALNGEIKMTKRVLAVSLIAVLLFFASLSGFRPFWLHRVIGINARVIYVPDDPENKQRWALHSESQDEKLFHMKCRELQEGGVIPQSMTPRSRRARRDAKR